MYQIISRIQSITVRSRPGQQLLRLLCAQPHRSLGLKHLQVRSQGTSDPWCYRQQSDQILPPNSPIASLYFDESLPQPALSVIYGLHFSRIFTINIYTSANTILIVFYTITNTTLLPKIKNSNYLSLEEFMILRNSLNSISPFPSSSMSFFTSSISSLVGFRLKQTPACCQR